ncbi:hypothetical protein D0Z07_4138, partial [Hyphodiscus hymeniophilus]
MHVIAYTALFGWLLAPVFCWFPGEHKQIRGIDGRNLFSPSQPHGSAQRRSIALPSTKIRGVNLGSLFVFEPWIAQTEWTGMGCGKSDTEFDCVLKLGQAKTNSSFAEHWDTWIVQSDIQTMQSYGLNTIRIPVGYWMMESLVYSSEHFPQGGLEYLQRVCGWASDAGMFIVIDMHGAPGAQTADSVSTGQNAKSPGFYINFQYQRGIKFVSWLANLTYTVNEFRNVGMIGIVNEPLQNTTNQTLSMRDIYYPEAYAAIRNVESSLNITQNNSLHIQVMNKLWGSGDPNQNLSDTYFMAYDDHRYLKLDDTVTVKKSSYISNSCSNNRSSDAETPTIVGEFSLSPPDDVEQSNTWETSGNVDFYTQWFAAQVTGYEKSTNGWIFWTWKTQLGDYRWSYSDAVAAGVIPKNLSSIDAGVCDG